MKDIFKQLIKIGKKEELFIVGGWIRDKVLNKENRDLDIITASNPIKIAKRASNILNGRLVLLDKENKIYRVVLKDNPLLDYIDFSKMKGTNIEKDLTNRDFTINSFAVPLKEKIELCCIIDPFNGIKDLKSKKIRLTSNHAITDDPLRMLRAFRFASEMGFAITPDTIREIKKHALRIKQSAWERIREEFFKILQTPRAHYWIEQLEKTGILEVLFPEITEMRKSGNKYYYHPKGLWQHSTETLRSFEDILNNTKKYFPYQGEKIQRHLLTPLSSGLTRASIIKIVCLFHDVAKPETAKRYGNKMRFLGHEEKGAKRLGEILKRLRVSSSDIRLSQNLVEKHMRPISLTQANVLTHRATFRFFRDMGDNVIDLLMLALSDWHSYKGLRHHDPSMLKKQEAVLKELIKRYFDEKEKPAMPKIIDGNILMNRLKLKPGPQIGKLLNKIKEAQYLGKIARTEDALALAKKSLKIEVKKRNV